MQITSEVKNGFKETEIGLIPEDWEIKKLGDILDLSNGKRPEFSEKGSYPVFGANGIMGYSTKFLINSDFTLVIGRVGASGEVHLAKGKVWISDNAIYSKAYNKTKVDLQFLHYLLKKIDLTRFATKTTHPLITKSFLTSFKIPLPPLLEQQKIAFVLSKIQQAIQQQDKIIEVAKNLKKTIMHKLFTEGIGHTEFKDTEIGKIPKSWEVIRLEKIANFQYGLTTSALKEAVGPKFLRITDIKDDGKISWDEVPHCKITSEEFEKYRLVEGDILVARIGATTGKTCIIQRPPNSVFGSYLIRILLNREQCFPEYLFYFTNTASYWTQINANKGGKLKKGVSASFLKTLLIPLAPIDEQLQIAHTIRKIYDKIEMEAKRKVSLQQLFKTMLHKLMTGEIRVKDLDLGVSNVN